MSTRTITNVRAVLPDRVLDDATIVIEDDRIAAIRAGGARGAPAVDGQGMVLMPGLIDTHSDGLEKEMNPRRTAVFPPDFALGSFERRVRSAGITTVVHGLAYQDRPRIGRSVGTARQIYELIETRRCSPSAAVEHRVLYRVEARDATSLDPLLVDLQHGRTAGLAAALVSFEDHTPGQGQYRDVTQFEVAIDPADIPDGMTVEEYVQVLKAEGDSLIELRDRNLDRLIPLARDGRITMLAHDAENPDQVVAAHDAGATVAEFPLTLDAAKEARSREMVVVMGGPNALRGQSHAGNASARELVATDLCDVIASDYMPSSLLASVFSMAAEGLCPLHRAVGLVTSGPAQMIGDPDRGRLEEGALADLILVDDSGPWPEPIAVTCATDGALTGALHR